MSWFPGGSPDSEIIKKVKGDDKMSFELQNNMHAVLNKFVIMFDYKIKLVDIKNDNNVIYYEKDRSLDTMIEYINSSHNRKIVELKIDTKEKCVEVKVIFNE